MSKTIDLQSILCDLLSLFLLRYAWYLLTKLKASFEEGSAALNQQSRPFRTLLQHPSAFSCASARRKIYYSVYSLAFTRNAHQ